MHILWETSSNSHGEKLLPFIQSERIYVISTSHCVLMQRACIFLCPQFECRKAFLWWHSLGGLSPAPSFGGHHILGGLFLFLLFVWFFFGGGGFACLFFFLVYFHCVCSHYTADILPRYFHRYLPRMMLANSDQK